MKRPSAALQPFLDLATFPRPLSPREAAQRLFFQLVGGSWSPRHLAPGDLSAPCDWTYFLSLATKHCLASAIHARLVEQRLNRFLPPHVRDALARHHATTLARNVLLLSETEKFCDRLHRHGIPVMLLKGMALLHGVYPHPALRPMTDVDILIHKRDVTAARRILLSECGYSDAGIETPAAEIVFGRTTLVKDKAPAHLGRILLELHWDIAPLEYEWKGRRPPVRECWHGARQVGIGASPAWMPADTDHLCYIAIHNCVHCFDRLMGLMDVAHLLARLCVTHAGDDLAHRAEKYGCRVDLFLNMALALALFGAPTPASLRSLAPAPCRMQPLARIFSRQALLDGEFSSTRRYMTRLLCADRLGDALRLVAWSLFPPQTWLDQRHDLQGMKRVKKRRLAHLLTLTQSAGNAIRKAVSALREGVKKR